MKIISLFNMAMFLFFSQGILAQITLTFDDLPQIGDVLVAGNDTTIVGITQGMGGADQVWDFSTLVADDTLTQMVVDPAATPGGAAFPTADVAYEGGEGEGVLYMEQIGDQIEVIGIVGDLTGMGDLLNVPLEPTRTGFVNMTTFGTMYEDTSAFEITIPTDPATGFDSARVKQVTVNEVVIDGYGEVITPLGSYDGLRQFTNSVTTDSLWIHSFFGWTFVTEQITSAVSYDWLSKENALSLVSLQFDDMDMVQSITYALIEPQPLPVAVFTFEELSAGTFEFTDQSTNDPTSWLWDLGDGTTSTEQNPMHIYAALGDYVVCLTVTNDFGSATTCQTITVAFAPQADYSFTDDQLGNYMFTDLSQFDPTMWIWDFGGLGTSTEQNPSFMFSASGSYNVCLTASNAQGEDTICKDVEVVISSTLEAEGLTGLTIFPNPANAEIKVRFENLYSKQFNWSISNMLGQKVFQSTLQNNMSINVEDWQTGFYQYHILNEEGAILKSDKVLIVR